jgi:hypothetical protein
MLDQAKSIHSAGIIIEYLALKRVLIEFPSPDAQIHQLRLPRAQGVPKSASVFKAFHKTPVLTYQIG